MEDHEKVLRELNNNTVTLTRQYNQKVEQMFVIKLGSEFFMRKEMEVNIYDSTKEQTTDFEKGPDAIRFGYLAGVLKVEHKQAFERMLFRATRGNCLVRFSDVTSPLANAETGEDERMSVFFVFYRSSLIESKARRIVEIFDGHMYDTVDFTDASAVSAAYSQVMSELEDAERVVNLNIDKCQNVLQEIAKYMQAWEWTVKKEKAVFDVINKFRPVASGNMYGEGWVLTETMPQLTALIRDVHRGKDSDGYMQEMPKPWPKPPTHFYTNEFTSITQVTIDTYGTPSYKECNPAVFTLVTFPFQFGIMFGDLGHGKGAGWALRQPSSSRSLRYTFCGIPKN